MLEVTGYAGQAAVYVSCAGLAPLVMPLFWLSAYG